MIKGTGKTTTARKMGQVFYDMGFISKVEVIECSASDLIGQYVGSTGPKTLAQLDKALGKVLFVDEAYRLAEGNFGTEAINELVDSLTKPKYMGKMIVILAGYDKDINQLIAVNPGLSSRFPEEIVFRNMNIENSLYLLENTIKKKEIQVPNLKDPKASLHLELVKLIENLASLPSWGNARDIISLGTTIARGVFGAKLDPMLPLKASYEDIVHHTKSLLAERQSRCRNLPSRDSSTFFSQMAQTQDNEPLIDSIATAETAKDTKLKEEKKASLPQVKDFRDPNVSNKVWRQLQADKEAADRALKVSEDEIEIRAEELRQAEEVEGESITAAKKLAQTATTNDDEMNELKRLREAARIQEQTARIAHWKALAEYERLKTEAENRKRHEAQMQAKLRKIGVCVAGYQWIKQSGGYRCAGGSHFVSNARLKM